jgi:ankyrin repeat protein
MACSVMTRNAESQLQRNISPQQYLSIQMLESMPRISVMASDNTNSEEKISVPCPPMTIMEDPCSPVDNEKIQEGEEKQVIACPAPVYPVEQTTHEEVRQIEETYMTNLNNYCINNENDLDNYFENPNMQIRNDCEYTPLFYLCYNYKHNSKKYINRIKTLIQRDVELNVRHKTSGYTPLAAIMMIGRNNNSPNLSNIIRLLIDGGADVNYCDTENTFYSTKFNNDNNMIPPLFRAIIFSKSHNLANIIPILINSGANINHRDRFGVTPLELSANNGVNNGITRCLINLGANINSQDINNDTTLITACDSYPKTSTFNIIKSIVDMSPDLNIKGKNQETALHRICRRFGVEFYNYHISKYKYNKNNRGKTSELKNKEKELIDFIEVINYLIDAGAHVHLTNINNFSPLMLIFQHFNINKPDWNYTSISFEYEETEQFIIYNLIRRLVNERVDLKFINPKHNTDILTIMIRFLANEELAKIIELLFNYDDDMNINRKFLIEDRIWTPVLLFGKYCSYSSGYGYINSEYRDYNINYLFGGLNYSKFINHTSPTLKILKCFAENGANFDFKQDEYYSFWSMCKFNYFERRWARRTFRRLRNRKKN